MRLSFVYCKKTDVLTQLFNIGHDLVPFLHIWCTETINREDDQRRTNKAKKQKQQEDKSAFQNDFFFFFNFHLLTETPENLKYSYCMCYMSLIYSFIYIAYLLTQQISINWSSSFLVMSRLWSQSATGLHSNIKELFPEVYTAQKGKCLQKEMEKSKKTKNKKTKKKTLQNKLYAQVPTLTHNL